MNERKKEREKGSGTRKTSSCRMCVEDWKSGAMSENPLRTMIPSSEQDMSKVYSRLSGQQTATPSPASWHDNKR